MTHRIQLREIAQEKFADPRDVLIEFRKFETLIAASPTPDRIKRLRTQNLKPEREIRDAALFCVGMSERLGHQVLFAPIEDQDFDFVASWDDGQGTQHFCRVQLKEVVPAHLNDAANVQGVIEKLDRYADLSDVTVAIKLNRRIRFEPSDVQVPAELSLGGLWIFGAIAPDQSTFALWGDFATMETAVGTAFEYPREP